jgi:hypothetical protein
MEQASTRFAGMEEIGEQSPEKVGHESEESDKDLIESEEMRADWFKSSPQKKLGAPAQASTKPEAKKKSRKEEVQETGPEEIQIDTSSWLRKSTWT